MAEPVAALLVIYIGREAVGHTEIQVSLDQEGATPVLTTYASAALEQHGLGIDPQAPNYEVSGLYWPENGWRLVQGVIRADDQVATLTVKVAEQKRQRTIHRMDNCW